MFYFSTKFKDCPTPGFYGERCSSPCPTTCVNGHCNRRGECLGCIIGYQGVHCDKGRCLFVSLFSVFLYDSFISLSVILSVCLSLSSSPIIYVSISLIYSSLLSFSVFLSILLSFTVSYFLSLSISGLRLCFSIPSLSLAFKYMFKFVNF